MMKYGDKRNYPKIDIYIQGKYIASTTWAKTCKEAKVKYIEKHKDITNVKCRRQPNDTQRTLNNSHATKD